jgi:hypothetical protein
MLRSSASNAQSRNRRCAVGAIVFGFFDEAFKLIDNVKFNTRLAELYKYLARSDSKTLACRPHQGFGLRPPHVFFYYQ